MFALLLASAVGCDKGGEENEEESSNESSGSEQQAAEEEAAQIDPALVGHWAQSSGDVLTFNSSGRVHMGSSGCVGSYTAVDGMIQTTFDNAGSNCQGSRFSYSIEGDTLNWLTTFTRQDAEDDTSL